MVGGKGEKGEWRPNRIGDGGCLTSGDPRPALQVHIE